MTDNIITKRNKSGVVVSYQSEFMQNYVAETKVNFAKGIKSVRIDNDKAIIFYIDSAGVLSMLVSRFGVDAEWSAVQISPEGYEATAFDIYFTEADKRLRICYGRRKDNASSLLVSEEVHINEESIRKISQYFKFSNANIAEPQRTIDHITCDTRGVLFSSQLPGTDAVYNYFKYGATPMHYTLPENTNQVKQLEVGSAYDLFGVFILYDMPGKGRTMLFQSFPEKEGSEIKQYRVQTGKTIECFGLIKNTDGNDILYVGGDGIYKFKKPRAVREEIAPPSFNCSRMDISCNANEETIWALNAQAQSLYYITNSFCVNGDSGNIEQKWTSPLLMQKDVQEYSSVKGTNLANQLFLFSAKEKSGLVHLWQDGVSKSWHETPVSVNDDVLKNALSVDSYTIDLNLVNENNTTITDSLQIGSKENLVLYINNRKYHITPSAPLALPFNNKYNIILPTDSLAVPEITVTAPYIDNAIVIDATVQIRQKIAEKIKTGSDIASAKKQDGTPLISGSYDAKTLDSIAKAIKNVSENADKIKGGTLPRRDEGKDERATQIAALNFQNGTGAVAQPSGGLLSGNAIGDILYAIKKGYETVTSFVVNAVSDGLQFVMEIGGKMIKWIAQAAKDAVAFLERVWEKVKVFFKDMVKFLAFLFDWDDILNTKEALKLTVKNILEMVNPQLRKAEQFVVEKIHELREYAKKMLGIADEQKLDTNFSNLATQQGAYTEKPVDSRVNWVDSKKELIFEAKNLSATSSDTSKVFDKITDQHSEPELKQIIDAIKDFAGGRISLGDFIKRLARILVDLAFDFIEKMARTLFEIVIAMVDVIKDMLQAKIEIPLISSIYKTISKSPLTILDFTCLIAAIPTTISFKLVNSVAPFKDEAHINRFATQISSSLF